MDIIKFSASNEKMFHAERLLQDIKKEADQLLIKETESSDDEQHCRWNLKKSKLGDIMLG